MSGEYGYITVKGERLPLTLRGYVAYLIVGGFVLTGIVYGGMLLFLWAAMG